MFGIHILFILLCSTHAMPNSDTTDNQVNKLEISTAPSQIIENTTADQLFENKTTSEFNVTIVSIMTTDTSIIPNSTAKSVVIAGKVVTYNTTYSYSSSRSSSDLGLSRGAVAGGVIGGILLMCFCAICDCCGKASGH